MSIISRKAAFTEEGTQVTVTIFVVVFRIVPMNESFVSFIGVIDPPPVNTNLYFSIFCSCSTISKSPSVFEGLPMSDCQYEALLRWMKLNHSQKDGYKFWYTVNTIGSPVR